MIPGLLIFNAAAVLKNPEIYQRVGEVMEWNPLALQVMAQGGFSMTVATATCLAFTGLYGIPFWENLLMLLNWYKKRALAFAKRPL